MDVLAQASKRAEPFDIAIFDYTLPRESSDLPGNANGAEILVESKRRGIINENTLVCIRLIDAIRFEQGIAEISQEVRLKDFRLMRLTYQPNEMREILTKTAAEIQRTNTGTDRVDQQVYERQ